MRELLRPAGLRIPLLIGLALAVLLPFLLDGGWLNVFTMALVLGIAAIGLALLYATGQLSLGHAFFMGVGAYGYAYFTGPTGEEVLGLGLPPVLALVLAVVLAGLAGALFSPIGSRLGGLPLAVATLGLVFLGHHLTRNATPVTGGSRGRVLDSFTVFGWTLDDPRTLWWFVVFVSVAAAAFAHHVMNSRIGLSLRSLHGGEIFAGTMGIDVRRRKASAFVVSSMYAGAAGALFAVVNGAIVPETFDLALSLNVLIMIVLGGASYVVSGSLVGALLITLLPELLREYASVVPFIAQDVISDGIAPTEAAQYLYGAAVVVLLIVEPGGLAVLARRVRAAIGRKTPGDKHDQETVPPGAAVETREVS